MKPTSNNSLIKSFAVKTFLLNPSALKTINFIRRNTHLRKVIPILFLCSLLYAGNSVFGQRPNIVLILIDDANKNYLPPNAPSYVTVPNIKRIYEEGALFTNFYGVYPLCNPSRYSLLTGVYPHVHGAIDNVSNVSNPSLTFFTSLLQTAGYHNLCIGKYSNVDDSPPYFEKEMCVQRVDYTDPKVTINGGTKTIAGNTTQIINDTMRKWIAKVDTPFFAWIGHIAPHTPVSVPEQDKSIYKQQKIPLPLNAHFFYDDYPSFLYASPDNFLSDTNKLKKWIEKEYEALLEVDRGIGDLFDTLTQRGLLDNTLIIFTNDNGAFYGEHYLTGKGKPYEAAASMPLFIRYPQYFPTDTSSVYSQFIESFDLTPTILFAAHIIPKPYHFQGISIMKQLYDNETRRSMVYFEKIQSPLHKPKSEDDATTPSWRAVRTANYKYVRYRCDSLVEELFDMKNDSLENTNLARNSSYVVTLNSMRLLLDSMMVATFDTLSIDTIIGDCHLVDLINNQRMSAALPFEVIAFPQPASDFVNINLVTGDGLSGNKNVRMELLNQLGIIIETWNFLPADGLTITIDTHLLAKGLYSLRTIRGDQVRSIPLLIQ